MSEKVVKDFEGRIKSEKDQELRERLRLVLDITEKAKAAGGRALVVGGFVRDELLGKPSKDIDVEVYGIEFEALKKILKGLGQVDLVGESFAVFKINGVDVSVPRKDLKSGRGHKGFQVEADPEMDFAKASSRRDFTVNALGLDPLTGQIHDEHGGFADIKSKVLRAVDAKTFGEDPLRALRAMQLAARFDFEIEEETKELCRELDLTELSGERIGQEWKKLLLRADKPSVGLEAARDLKIVEKLYPELEALVDVPQDVKWHPEGDVWIHTKMVADEAAQIMRRESLDDQDSQVLMLAAVCHDLGKPTTTAKEGKRVRSKGHEQAGIDIAKGFMDKLDVPKKIVNKVLRLVAEHRIPAQVTDPSRKAVRRLAKRLEPATIQELMLLSGADLAARGAASRELTEAQEYLRIAREEAVESGGPKPLVTGEDLLELGHEAGPEMGRVLSQLYEAQLDGEFESREGGLEFYRKQSRIK